MPWALGRARGPTPACWCAQGETSLVQVLVRQCNGTFTYELTHTMSLQYQFTVWAFKGKCTLSKSVQWYFYSMRLQFEREKAKVRYQSHIDTLTKSHCLVRLRISCVQDQTSLVRILKSHCQGTVTVLRVSIHITSENAYRGLCWWAVPKCSEHRTHVSTPSSCGTPTASWAPRQWASGCSGRVSWPPPPALGPGCTDFIHTYMLMYVCVCIV